MPEVQSHADQTLEDSSEVEHLVSITNDEARRSLASQAGMLISVPIVLAPFSQQLFPKTVIMDVLF